MLAIGKHTEVLKKIKTCWQLESTNRAIRDRISYNLSMSGSCYTKLL